MRVDHDRRATPANAGLGRSRWRRPRRAAVLAAYPQTSTTRDASEKSKHPAWYASTATSEEFGGLSMASLALLDEAVARRPRPLRRVVVRLADLERRRPPHRHPSPGGASARRGAPAQRRACGPGLRRQLSLAGRAAPVGQRSADWLVPLHRRRRALEGHPVPRRPPPAWHLCLGPLGRHELRRVRSSPAGAPSLVPRNKLTRSCSTSSTKAAHDPTAAASCSSSPTSTTWTVGSRSGAASTSGSCATPGATSSACFNRTSRNYSPGDDHGPPSVLV
jgi:hypothetical protein